MHRPIVVISVLHKLRRAANGEPAPQELLQDSKGEWVVITK